MASDTQLVNGPFRIDALGTVTIIARGTGALFSAPGVDSDLSLDAGSSIGITTGPATICMANDEETGSIAVLGGELGTITQSVGVPEEGPTIEMTPETLTMSVGVTGVGASLIMTAESITLKVGTVSLTLTAEGILETADEVTREVTAEGHNLTAAETELNVGVSGITAEVPTKEEETEGTATINETIGTHVTDATKTEDAGIIMTE